MSELKIEHRGYAIRYAQNSDTWTCRDLDVDAPTLTKAKDAVNALLLKHRKAAALSVVVLGQPHAGGYVEGRAIDHKSRPQIRHEKLGPRATSTLRFTEHLLGVMSVRHGDARPGKSFIRLCDLAPPTDEVFAAIKAHATLLHAVKKLESQARKAHAAIPRVSEPDIAALVASCLPETEDL
jgi:hypothetical protein